MSSGFSHITVPNERNQPRGRWFKNISKNNNSNRITAGPGVIVTQTGSGITISTKPSAKVVGGAGGTSISNGIACKITGGTTLAGYAVQVFGNGPANPYTSTGTLFLLECAGTSNLPIGAWTMGFVYNTLTITGGNE